MVRRHAESADVWNCGGSGEGGGGGGETKERTDVARKEGWKKEPARKRRTVKTGGRHLKIEEEDREERKQANKQQVTRSS